MAQCQRILPIQEMQAMLVRSLGGEDPLEEETATHSSLLQSCLENPMDKGAWWAIRSQRVRHDWAYMQKIYIYIYAHYVCIHIHHILIIVCRLATKFQLIIFCVSKMAWPIEAYQNLFRKQICGKGNIFKFWQMNDEFLNAIKIRKYILERKKSPWIYYLELHHR